MYVSERMQLTDDPHPRQDRQHDRGGDDRPDPGAVVYIVVQGRILLFQDCRTVSFNSRCIEQMIRASSVVFQIPYHRFAFFRDLHHFSFSALVNSLRHP